MASMELEFEFPSPGHSNTALVEQSLPGNVNISELPSLYVDPTCTRADFSDVEVESEEGDIDKLLHGIGDSFELTETETKFKI